MTQISARVRIYFDAERAIGPGRIELLEGVHNTGSLVQAARGMNMSYRRAWQLLQSLNRSLLNPVCVSVKGGRGGGGAQLTPAGKALIRAYRSFESRVRRESRLRFRPFAPRRARCD